MMMAWDVAARCWRVEELKRGFIIFGLKLNKRSKIWTRFTLIWSSVINIYKFQEAIFVRIHPNLIQITPYLITEDVKFFQIQNHRNLVTSFFWTGSTFFLTKITKIWYGFLTFFFERDSPLFEAVHWNLKLINHFIVRALLYRCTFFFEMWFLNF